MKNYRKILILMFVVLLVCLFAACENSLSEESSTNKQSKIKENSTTPNTTEKTSNEDTLNLDNHDTNEEVDTSNNVTEKDKESSINHTTVSQKEKYLRKLKDTKKEMEKLRKTPEDPSTYALKKVEGEIYDSWDGLLNEIYGFLKGELPPNEMDQLRKEQRNWIKNRDDAAKEASLKYEGGTMEQLEYVAVLANLTEKRCFELVDEYM